jgi:hypothetical protein
MWLSGIAVAIVYLIGLAWPFVLGESGVASDFVRIPFGFKVLLTFGSIVIPLLLMVFGRRTGIGCGCGLALYCFILVCVMWYWN